MSHRDTSVAIKEVINGALNVRQGNKRSYQTNFNWALNVTQGYKCSNQSSLIYAKYLGTISACMFQQGKNINRSNAKWSNAELYSTNAVHFN